MLFCKDPILSLFLLPLKYPRPRYSLVVNEAAKKPNKQKKNPLKYKDIHLYLTILTMLSRALVSMMLILLLQPIYADSVLQMKSEISLSTMFLE